MTDAYAELIAEVSAGRFGAPAPGQWSAEQIAAHVARNHEALIEVSEAVLRGDQVCYDNREVTRDRVLDAYVTAHGGLAGLGDRLAVTVTALRELVAALAETGMTAVPVRIQDGADVVVHQPMPWIKVLEIDRDEHVPRHLAQLRALRPAEAGPADAPPAAPPPPVAAPAPPTTTAPPTQPATKRPTAPDRVG